MTTPMMMTMTDQYEDDEIDIECDSDDDDWCNCKDETYDREAIKAISFLLLFNGCNQNPETPEKVLLSPISSQNLLRSE